MSADVVLRVDGVSLTFGGLVALDGVDLEVGAGTTHGIIGPNGAGKTTTFDVITGVYRPNSGSVVLDGTDVTSRSPHRRAWAGLARTFQTVGLAPGLTARDNVLATIEALERVRTPFVRPSTARRRAQEVDELLRYFQLDEYAAVQVTELPLGITKLLELAKVFAGRPKVVLLDEPFAGLSTGEARERVKLLTARREETGVGVVIVEHDVPLLLESCDQLSVLDAGRVVVSGEPGTVMASASVREAYMGEVVEEVVEEGA